MRTRRNILIASVGLLGCTASLDLPPDTAVPQLQFESPHNGENLTGLVNIQITASDNVSVERIQLFIDGNLQATFYARPYFMRWNVSTLPVGSTHTIRAEAIDPSQNKGTAEITVTTQGGEPLTPQP